MSTMRVSTYPKIRFGFCQPFWQAHHPKTPSVRRGTHIFTFYLVFLESICVRGLSARNQPTLATAYLLSRIAAKHGARTRQRSELPRAFLTYLALHSNICEYIMALTFSPWLIAGVVAIVL